MPEPSDSNGAEQTTTDESDLLVRRRDVMKAAGAAGVVSGGFASVASAQCPSDCDPGSGPDNCSACLPNSCKFLDKVKGNNQRCQTVDPPSTATHAVIKAGQKCHVDNLDDNTVCVPEDCKEEISHVEFYACADASISVSCPTATVSVEGTDSVYFEVAYQHCDVSSDSGTLSGSGGSWSATVPLEECEGTITVWLSSSKSVQLDSATFDCETASVSVDCPSGSNSPVATISAEDTSTVNYSVNYDGGCSNESGSVDLSGTTDSVDVTLQNCGGTITLTDDDGRRLDSTSFQKCCVPCPSGLDLKFEGGEIAEGNSKSYGGITFTITSVTTKDSDEPIGVCFTTDQPICGSTLELTVKTGEFTKTADVTASGGEYCFDVDPDDGKFDDENDPVQGISHFTIRCP